MRSHDRKLKHEFHEWTNDTNNLYVCEGPQRALSRLRGNECAQFSMAPAGWRSIAFWFRQAQPKCELSDHRAIQKALGKWGSSKAFLFRSIFLTPDTAAHRWAACN